MIYDRAVCEQLRESVHRDLRESRQRLRASALRAGDGGLAEERRWSELTGMELYTNYDELRDVPKRYVPMRFRWWGRLLIFLGLASR